MRKHFHLLLLLYIFPQNSLADGDIKQEQIIKIENVIGLCLAEHSKIVKKTIPIEVDNIVIHVYESGYHLLFSKEGLANYPKISPGYKYYMDCQVAANGQILFLGSPFGPVLEGSFHDFQLSNNGQEIIEYQFRRSGNIFKNFDDVE